MKIKCKYSGVEFSVEYFQSFSLTKGQDSHPIFNLSSRDLLIRARDWRSERFTEVEQKLWFLALLKRTNAVNFMVIPDPSLRTIARNIPPLVKLVGAANILENSSIKLPKYSITEETKDLSNLHNWILEWNAVKEEYLNPLSRHYIKKKSLTTELALDRLLASPYKKLEQLAPRLYTWTMMQLPSLSKENKEYYRKFFFLSDKELFSLPNSEVRELNNFLKQVLEVELYSEIHFSPSQSEDEINSGIFEESRKGNYGSNYADAVLRLIRGKLQKAVGGLIGDLGGSYYNLLDDLEDIEDTKNLESKLSGGQNLKEDTSEIVTLKKRALEIRRKSSLQGDSSIRDIDAKRALAAAAPEKEPLAKDYPGNLSGWIKDKAAWNALVSLRKSGIEVISLSSSSISASSASFIEEKKEQS